MLFKNKMVNMEYMKLSTIRVILFVYVQFTADISLSPALRVCMRCRRRVRHCSSLLSIFFLSLSLTILSVIQRSLEGFVPLTGKHLNFCPCIISDISPLRLFLSLMSLFLPLLATCILGGYL